MVAGTRCIVLLNYLIYSPVLLRHQPLNSVYVHVNEINNVEGMKKEASKVIQVT